MAPWSALSRSTRIRWARTGRGDRPDVVGQDEVAAVEEGPGLGRPVQAHARPGARPELDLRPAAGPGHDRHEVGRPGRPRRGPCRAPSRRPAIRSGARTTGTASSGSASVAAWRPAIRRSAPALRVADPEPDEEPVELGLGQRERALRTRSGSGWPGPGTDRAAAGSRPRPRPGAPASPRAARSGSAGVARLISSTSRTFVKTGPGHEPEGHPVRRPALEDARPGDVARAGGPACPGSGRTRARAPARTPGRGGSCRPPARPR